MTDRRPAGKYNNIVKSINTNSSAGANVQTDVPKTLRCVFCQKDKPLEAFSATMISKATYNPYAPPSFNAKKKVISCKNCTSSSTTHLTCMICSKRKPLNNFANTQRKNHDRARCKICIEKRQEEDVWSDNNITDSEDDY
ncbi:hypothetical protein PS15p_200705 [Mucor circinelloides]